MQTLAALMALALVALGPPDRVVAPASGAETVARPTAREPSPDPAKDRDSVAARKRCLRDNDAASLLLLFQHIKGGMSRGEVVELLGEPAYSPTDGIDYYSAGGAPVTCRIPEDGPAQPCGVVVEYLQRGDGTTGPINTVQTCSFGAIGE